MKRKVLVVSLAAVLGACAAPPTATDDPVARIEDKRHPESKRLIELLGDPSAERRARAALAMGRIQSTSYVGPLTAAVRDEVRSVRLAALFAIGQLGLLQGGPPPEAAVEACLPALADADATVVSAALEALGKLALARVPRIVTPLLETGAPQVRAAAAMALFRCRFAPLWRGEVSEPPALPEASVQALLDAVEDPEVAARRMAVYAFSRYAQPEAAGRLAGRLDDEDEWTRLFALRGIGRSGEGGAAAAVVSALDDASDRVRTEAVGALAALGLADRLPSSLAADSSFHVRTAFAAALGAAEAPQSIRTLRGLEDDLSPTVRAVALESLARRLQGAFAGEIEQRLEHDDWRTRVAAARAARHLGRAGRAVVEIAMDDADNRVRAAGLSALGTLGSDLAIALDALAVDDLAVRGTAVELLGGAKEVSGPFGAVLLERLAETYDTSPGLEWIEVREGIVDAAAPLVPAEKLLRRMAQEDTAFSVRAKARAALAERGVELPGESEPAAEASHLLGVRFDVDPVIVLETSKGEIRIRCLAEEAPVHVASFVGLAREGYYDGLIWHRVVSNFVIQGGDPRGDGWGGAGYALRDEIHGARFGRGAVGMPKAGKDTGGGQIFITHIPTPHLEGNYTIFGQVVEGLEVVDRIEVGDVIVRARVE